MSRFHDYRHLVYFPDAKACGFFIRPNTILTAGHVVKNYSIDQLVRIRYQSHDEPLYAKLITKLYDPTSKSALDVAYLQTESDCGEIWGYNIDIPQNREKLTIALETEEGHYESFEVDQDGERFTHTIPDLIGISKHAAIDPGFSGAPVHRKSDLSIIGFMTRTRAEKTGQGGYFVPLARIVEALPTLQLDQTANEPLAAPDIGSAFELLSAKHRLTDYVGLKSNQQLDQLEHWFITPSSSPQFLIMGGPGGSGKTRMASELIRRLRQKGLQADFWDGNADPPETPGLLVVDDFENWAQFIDDAFKQVINNKVAIRVILLSRNPPKATIERLYNMGYGQFIHKEETRISWLRQTEIVELFRQCAKALEDTYDRLMPLVTDDDLDFWSSRNTLMNGLPLYVIALSVAIFLNGRESLYFREGELLPGLVRHELQRLEKASLQAKLEKHSLSRLSAFSAICGNLDIPLIKRLGTQANGVFETSPALVIDRLKLLPWFTNNRWSAPAPDIMAAALAYEVFKDREDMAVEWLSQLLADADGGIVLRVERILEDLHIFAPKATRQFTDWMLMILMDNYHRADDLYNFIRSNSKFLAPFCFEACNNLLELEPETKDNEAYILRRLAAHSYNMGDIYSAIESRNKELIVLKELSIDSETHRQLLIICLIQLSVYHWEDQNHETAISCITDALNILIEYTKDSKNSNLLYARCYEYHAFFLSQQNNYPEAIKNLQQSIEIFTHMSHNLENGQGTVELVFARNTLKAYIRYSEAQESAIHDFILEEGTPDITIYGDIAKRLDLPELKVMRLMQLSELSIPTNAQDCADNNAELEPCSGPATLSIRKISFPYTPQMLCDYHVKKQFETTITNTIDIDTLFLEFAVGVLLQNQCWKCHKFGWTYAIITERSPFGSILVGNAAFMPKTDELLRAYFKKHQDIRKDFGRVKKRFSKTLGFEYISQGCPHCDALWGDYPLGEVYTKYAFDIEERNFHDTCLFAWECDLRGYIIRNDTRLLKIADSDFEIMENF